MDLQKINQEVANYLGHSGEIVVTDEKDLKVINDRVIGIKALIKSISETFDPIIDKANKAHKEALSQKKNYVDPLKKALSIHSDAITNYFTELERKAEEARVEAEKREQAILDAKADQLKKAEEAIEAGDMEKAKEVLREDLPKNSVVYIPPRTPILEGSHITKRWKWKVVNELEIPREYLTKDIVKLNKLAVETKGRATVPGIEFYQESGLAVRGEK